MMCRGLALERSGKQRDRAQGGAREGIGHKKREEEVGQNGAVVQSVVEGGNRRERMVGGAA
jgi:hypothetical protein